MGLTQDTGTLRNPCFAFAPSRQKSLPTNMEGNRQPELIALCTVLLALSMIVVGIRCLSTWAQPNHRFGWDDGLALTTMVSSRVRTVDTGRILLSSKSH